MPLMHSKRFCGSPNLTSRAFLVMLIGMFSILAGLPAHAVCAPVQLDVEMTPEVQAIVQSKTHDGDLARCYMRYMDALKNPDKIDDVATPDARFHDLEAMGYPKGPEGLKAFRRWLNTQVPDEHGKITAMRFPENDIIEVDIEASGHDPKTGQPALLTVHAKDRFVGDRIAERWDTAEWHTPRPQGSNAKQ
jgi:SnoaL-like polyketide cyclase